TDVLIQVEQVGVCGSDVHYFETGCIGDQIVEFPWLVGHESAGTVLEVGTAVKGLSAGDRVAVDPAIACGTCDQCRSGRENTQIPGLPRPALRVFV
ncbi:alcohol dehydrogenase catalytic domain-containing protein, partial [Planctomycetota bacterium]